LTLLAQLKFNSRLWIVQQSSSTLTPTIYSKIALQAQFKHLRITYSTTFPLPPLLCQAVHHNATAKRFTKQYQQRNVLSGSTQYQLGITCFSCQKSSCLELLILPSMTFWDGMTFWVKCEFLLVGVELTLGVIWRLIYILLLVCCQLGMGAHSLDPVQHHNHSESAEIEDELLIYMVISWSDHRLFKPFAILSVLLCFWAHIAL
jgi:hypothetical protein